MAYWSPRDQWVKSKELCHKLSFFWLVSLNHGLRSRSAGIILCMHPANERRRYDVTWSLIGWAHAQNGPWECADDVPSRQGLHTHAHQCNVIISNVTTINTATPSNEHLKYNFSHTRIVPTLPKQIHYQYIKKSSHGFLVRYLLQVSVFLFFIYFP